MRVGIISVFVDYHRRGRKLLHSLQPQIGPLLAGLLPRSIEIEIINETSQDVDWKRDYDLIFISSLHPDMDRARQISHYWRCRGAKTVIGGSFASSFPQLCDPWFDTVVIGDPEGSVPQLYRDFCANALKKRYVSLAYDPELVPTPRFDLFAGTRHHTVCFEATRGCPFSCEFCVLTGLGTRHQTRPIGNVVRDILAGQQVLAETAPRYKRRIVGFCDNNIGGNLPIPPLALRCAYAVAALMVWRNHLQRYCKPGTCTHDGQVRLLRLVCRIGEFQSSHNCGYAQIPECDS